MTPHQARNSSLGRTKDSTVFSVKEGDVVEFHLISWDDGWEFGRPIVMLSPVRAFFQDGSEESIVENACIDLVVNRELPRIHKACQKEAEWREFDFEQLHNAFHSIRGKNRPSKKFIIYFKRVKIIRDERDNGHLFWEDLDQDTPPQNLAQTS